MRTARTGTARTGTARTGTARTGTARRTTWAAALGAAALLGVVAAAPAPPAGAPSSGAGTHTPPVVSETLSEGTTDGPFTIRAKDDRRFVHRKLTVQPGATGGWHTHAGEQVAIIVSGELTRYDARCRPHVHRGGDAVVEPADPRDVHIGINTGEEPLVLYVVDMLPEDAPVAVPADNPGCENLPE